MFFLNLSRYVFYGGVTQKTKGIKIIEAILAHVFWGRNIQVTFLLNHKPAFVRPKCTQARFLLFSPIQVLAPDDLLSRARPRSPCSISQNSTICHFKQTIAHFPEFVDTLMRYHPVHQRSFKFNQGKLPKTTTAKYNPSSVCDDIF